MSIFLYSLKTRSINWRTWASSVRDAATARTRAPAWRSSSARSSTLLCVRAQIASAAPFSASTFATVCPTCPSLLTPVTRATFPSRMAGMFVPLASCKSLPKPSDRLILAATPNSAIPARQHLESSQGFRRAKLLCLLVPGTCQSDIRGKSLDAQLLEHDRIVGSRQDHGRSRVAAFRRTLQHQSRGGEISDRDESLSPFHQIGDLLLVELTGPKTLRLYRRR